MKVVVTQEHIDVGTPDAWSECYCPVALAMKDAVGAGGTMSVYLWQRGDRSYYSTATYFNLSDLSTIRYQLPEQVTAFIRSLGRTGAPAPSPFEFELGAGQWEPCSPQWDES